LIERSTNGERQPEPSEALEVRTAHAPDLLDALRVSPAVERETVLDPWEELAAARAREADARAMIVRLEARIASLESWLDADAGTRRIEHLQTQRLLLLQAARRDRRWWFVLSLPIVLCVLYVAGVAVLVLALVLGRL
jgi:hypothetical protein